MANKPKRPMPVSERAKQFSPFAAVAGLDKALAKEERALFKTEKLELSEDAEARLNKTLSSLKKGDSVKAEYYSEGEYLTVNGVIEVFDCVNRVLKIGGITIGFDELYFIGTVKK